ncbi:MAG: hypothetical protein ISP94_00915 [SAR86 cluster bacterium]|uniref:Cell shape-determining protein MreC n=1 Tax=SAR86 cluster bacterium TaxID=2030880 RepID=A0A937IEH2_9GAMM|nr:hypothetical protein [SAR86 cluster bacterium]MBL6819663.1 hypothetical protein [SAR86 cluster bacterium]MDA0899913.1 hypothetical protein [Pseudomonadota bacterium]
MQAKKLSFRDKIETLILSIFLIIFLGYLSYFVDLNKKSHRFLEMLFSLPSEFFQAAFENIREYENKKIFELENKIMTLESDIYEKNLEILALENKKNFSSNTISRFNNFQAYVSGFDQVNYLCCRKHRIYISTDNTTNIVEPRAISQGSFVVGRASSTIFNEAEVKLLSDPEEFISIKNSLGFFCIAQGTGMPQGISCNNESKTSEFKIGDTFFTTGFDGLYPEGLIIGRLDKVIDNEGPNFKQTLHIKLFFNPYNSMNKQLLIHE